VEFKANLIAARTLKKEASARRGELQATGLGTESFFVWFFHWEDRHR
jgi:hypothetical protein